MISMFKEWIANAFGNPRMLWLLLITLPLLSLFLGWAWKKRQSLTVQFVQSRLLAHLTEGVSRTVQKARWVIQIVAVGLLLLTLAQPRWGFAWEEAKQRGRDIIVAIDTSRSMLAEDLTPNRLTRAKLAALDLMRLAKSDRLGLVAFAGTAFLQCPLTLDEEAFRQSVEALQVGIIPQGGSALTEAIDAALKAFSSEADNYKVLVLLSDGEDHETGPLEAAQKAAEAGLRIFSVGVGTPNGELLRLRDEKGALTYVKDDQGNVVKSRLNETLLTQIATTAKGFYLPMAGANTVQVLYDRGLAPLPKTEHSSKLVKRYHERFQWFLALAIVLLLLEMFLPDRKRVQRTDVPPSSTTSKDQVPAGVFAGQSSEGGTRRVPALHKVGRDGFHSVPDFSRPAGGEIRDAVERVPTRFMGAKRQFRSGNSLHEPTGRKMGAEKSADIFLPPFFCLLPGKFMVPMRARKNMETLHEPYPRIPHAKTPRRQAKKFELLCVFAPLREPPVRLSVVHAPNARPDGLKALQEPGRASPSWRADFVQHLLGRLAGTDSPFRAFHREGERRVVHPAGFLTRPAMALLLLTFCPLIDAASPAKAQQKYEAGQFKAAEQEYQRLLQKKPDDPRLHYNAGTAAYQAAEFEEATKHFNASLTSPDLDVQHRSFYNLGNSLFRLGEAQTEAAKKKQAWEQAVKQYESALKLNSADDDAKFNLEFTKKKLEELQKQQDQSTQQYSKDDDKNEKKEKDEKGDKKDQSEQNKDQQDKESKSRPESDKSKENPQQQDQQEKKKDEQKDQSQPQNKDGQEEKQKSKPENKSGTPNADKSADKSDKADKSEGEQVPFGQMTQEQVKRLLDAQKNEEKAMIFLPKERPSRKDRIFKDW